MKKPKRSAKKSKPKSKPEPARRRHTPARRAALPPELRAEGLATMTEAVAARDVFWQNVIRQILTSLSAEWLNRSQLAGAALPSGGTPGSVTPPAEDLFDGRLGILTSGGERIPIAQVFPVLACGVGTTDAAKLLSLAVECSVFQIRTPTGEVFTLPLREMRGFHALTPELMQALEAAARREAEPEDQAAQEGPGTPFGFAAFTSMERAGRERRQGIAYPQHAPDAPNPHPDE